MAHYNVFGLQLVSMIFILQSKQQLIILLPGRFISGSLVWLPHEEWRPSIPYNGHV